MMSASTTILPEDDRRLAVLIVDDHEVVHWGFRLKLSRERWVRRCVGARNTEEAIAMTRRYEPNVALVDLRLEGESGVDVCQKIREVSPSTKVLLMSGSGRITNGTARAVGASGFVPKTWPTADILRAVHAVGLGGVQFAPVPHLGASQLTPREREVLDLLAEGLRNREIGGRLYLSPHTVKEHVSSVYRKLDVRNRAEAVNQAQRLGFLT
jgi:DNA-binding NarL/FixJ family response regulator